MSSTAKDTSTLTAANILANASVKSAVPATPLTSAAASSGTAAASMNYKESADNPKAPLNGTILTALTVTQESATEITVEVRNNLSLVIKQFNLQVTAKSCYLTIEFRETIDAARIEAQKQIRRLFENDYTSFLSTQATLTAASNSVENPNIIKLNFSGLATTLIHTLLLEICSKFPTIFTKEIVNKLFNLINQKIEAHYTNPEEKKKNPIFNLELFQKVLARKMSAEFSKLKELAHEVDAGNKDQECQALFLLALELEKKGLLDPGKTILQQIPDVYGKSRVYCLAQTGLSRIAAKSLVIKAADIKRHSDKPADADSKPAAAGAAANVPTADQINRPHRSSSLPSNTSKPKAPARPPKPTIDMTKIHGATSASSMNTSPTTPGTAGNSAVSAATIPADFSHKGPGVTRASSASVSAATSPSKAPLAGHAAKPAATSMPASPTFSPVTPLSSSPKPPLFPRIPPAAERVVPTATTAVTAASAAAASSPAATPVKNSLPAPRKATQTTEAAKSAADSNKVKAPVSTPGKSMTNSPAARAQSPMGTSATPPSPPPLRFTPAAPTAISLNASAAPASAASAAATSSVARIRDLIIAPALGGSNSLKPKNGAASH